MPLYNWAITSYAPDGDVLAMTDDVMGSWTYTYDAMNRLTNASATGGVDDGLTLGWTYDRYGNRGPRGQVFVRGVINRWAQNATGTGNASAVQPQLTFFGTGGVNTNRIDGWSYNAAGNLAPGTRIRTRFTPAPTVRTNTGEDDAPRFTPPNPV